MSESNQIDINSLHNTVLRETENNSLLEISVDFLHQFIINIFPVQIIHKIESFKNCVD